MQRIKGTYYLAGRSDTRPALALLRDDGSLRIIATDYDYELATTTLQECHEGDVLPDLPVELHLPDGDYFLPDDALYRWHPKSGFIAYIESHLLTVILAALLVPASFWFIFNTAIPATARVTAPMIPEEILNRMGESSLKTVDYFLEESEIPDEERQSIIAEWQEAADNAGLENHYNVLFRRGATPTANAFALADGTVVIFDGLVKKLSREELIAVLFHEAGHVDLHHHPQMVIQASAGAVIYGLLLSDMEGLSEAILGTGISLGQNAFSRRMETEADDFAARMLTASGRQPIALADALKSIGGDRDATNNWREYLSTHPDTQKRTQRIENPEAIPD